MARSCMQSSTCAVESMTIFKLLCWLADAHLSKLCLQVDTETDNAGGNSSVIIHLTSNSKSFQVSLIFWSKDNVVRKELINKYAIFLENISVHMLQEL